MRRLINIYLLLTLCCTGTLWAQHFSLFSQYVVNGLVINPAYAGKNEVLDITTLHRRQWTGFSGAPVTTAFSVNSPLRKNQVNLGLNFQDDRIGARSSQFLSAIYAYRFKTGKIKISLGGQAGMCFSNARWSELKKNDADDDLLINATQNMHGFFAGAGIYLHNEKFFCGFSSPYLLAPGNSIQPLSTPFLFTGGYLLKLKDKHLLKTSFLFKNIQAAPSQTDINLNYYYDSRFGIGLSYRIKESLIAIAEFSVNEQMRIAYSYDFSISALRKYNSGSHELMMRYYFGYSRRARNPRTFLY